MPLYIVNFEYPSLGIVDVKVLEVKDSMTYTVERYFRGKQRTYGPYIYRYRSERVGGRHRCVFVEYVGKGSRPLSVDRNDLREALSEPGDLADAVRVVSDEEEFVTFDLETTGFTPKDCGVIQVCGVRSRAEKSGLRHIESYTEFVNPGRPIPPMIRRLTNISDSMVAGARRESVVMPEFKRWIGDRPVVGHNVAFDMRFLKKRIGQEKIIDTLRMSRALYGTDVKHKLPDVAKREGVQFKPGRLHRADEDVRITAECFVRMARKIGEFKKEK